MDHQGVLPTSTSKGGSFETLNITQCTLTELDSKVIHDSISIAEGKIIVMCCDLFYMLRNG